MYLETLNIYNFRKYSTNNSDGKLQPGLSISFQKGVNVLIGENDSGKTAIIDAIRYVLKTQSGEFIQVEEKDFYQEKQSSNRASWMRIECIFKGFSDNDAGHFLEWLGLCVDANENTEYELKIWLTAKISDNKVIQKIKAGVSTEGSYIEGEAKDLLRVVYLKPLRDALSDMTHGNKSRLAQILKSHPIFKSVKDETGEKTKHDLENKYKILKDSVDEYFSKDGENGNKLSKNLNELLGNHFLTTGDERTAGISLTANELTDILKQLDLILEPNKSGLGTLNLLCIAAEFLLYTENKIGLKLTLIEEIEAHLHPQYQLRLIDFVSQHSKYGQFILTTHSTTLASKIPLKNIILCKGGQVYPLGVGTLLEESDYKFLQRFLDATKANMFFAQGLIIVEGDAENLLIPTIAELINRPLHKYGVSIVNVGSTAFKRYVKIFQRSDGRSLDMPISIISDLDIRSLEYYIDNGISAEARNILLNVTNEFKTKLSEIVSEIDFSELPSFFVDQSDFKDYIMDHKPNRLRGGSVNVMKNLMKAYDLEPKETLDTATIELLRVTRRRELETQWNIGNTKIFLPQKWTLEYDLACSSIYRKLALAIMISKYEKSYPTKIASKEQLKNWEMKITTQYPEEQVSEKQSYEIFKPLCKGYVSKASTAQYLASILSLDEAETISSVIKEDTYLQYIIDAIYHVTES